MFAPLALRVLRLRTFQTHDRSGRFVVLDAPCNPCSSPQYRHTRNRELRRQRAFLSRPLNRAVTPPLWLYCGRTKPEALRQQQEAFDRHGSKPAAPGAMFSSFISVLQGDDANDSDSETGEAKPDKEAASSSAWSYNLTDLANGLVESVKEHTNEFTHTVTSTDWTSEINAFTSEVKKGAAEVAEVGFEQLEPPVA